VAKRIKDIEAKLGGMTLDGKEVLRLFQRIEGKRPRRLPNSGADEAAVPGNDVRAAWAAIALHVFAATTGQDTVAELEDVICDLMCDLGHFCDRASLEFPRLLRRAADHYGKETRDKGGQLRNLS